MNRNTLIFMEKEESKYPWKNAGKSAVQVLHFMEQNLVPSNNMYKGDSYNYMKKYEKEKIISLRRDIYNDWLDNRKSGRQEHIINDMHQLLKIEHRDVYFILHEALLEKDDMQNMYKSIVRDVENDIPHLAQHRKDIHFVIVASNENNNYKRWTDLSKLKGFDISLIMPWIAIYNYKNHSNKDIKYYPVYFENTSSEYERSLILKKRLENIIANNDKNVDIENQKALKFEEKLYREGLIREKEEKIKILKQEIALLKKQR